MAQEDQRQIIRSEAVVLVLHMRQRLPHHSELSCPERLCVLVASQLKHDPTVVFEQRFCLLIPQLLGLLGVNLAIELD